MSSQQWKVGVKVAKRQGAPIQFRNTEVERQLKARGANTNSIANRDLSRYYELLRREMQSLGLAEEQEYLIADACGGREFTFDTAEFIWAMVQQEARRRDLGRKWQVNLDILIARIEHLSPGQAIALVDWCERLLTDPDVPNWVKDKWGRDSAEDQFKDG